VISEHQSLQRRPAPSGGAPASLRKLATSPSAGCIAGERGEISTRLGGPRLQLLLNLTEAIGRAVAAQLRLKIATRLLEGFALAGLDLNPDG